VQIMNAAWAAGAMQVTPALINEIFISHLHGDHYADLPTELQRLGVDVAEAGGAAEPLAR
jgi:ribonuclease BN (tRNA processing enzyme)